MGGQALWIALRCVTSVGGHESNIVTFMCLSAVFELLCVRHGAGHWEYANEQGKRGPCLSSVCGRRGRLDRGRQPESK